MRPSGDVNTHRALIIGGGFGGLNAACELGGDERFAVTLVDRRTFHTFQPLLYQVATGAISPGDIAQLLRSILRKRRNVTVLLGEAVVTDRAGRITVNPDLTLSSHPEILVLGDAAVQPWKDGRPVPGVAQGAIQAGTFAGRSIGARQDGRPAGEYRSKDKGDVAVIGRVRGVTSIGWLGRSGRQGGFIAWFMWLVIHILYLIGFANRIVVMVRWAWSFFASGRGTRLITGPPLLPPIETPAPPAWTPSPNQVPGHPAAARIAPVESPDHR